MTQVSEDQSSFDKFILFLISFCVAIAFLWSGIVYIWNAKITTGTLLVVAGLLLGILSIRKATIHLRKSSQAKSYSTHGIILWIMDLFK